MKPAILWPLVALIAIVMGGAITLRILGEDIQVVILLVSILVVPALGAFGVKIHENLQEVKASVNGNQSDLVKTIQQGQMVAGDNMRQLQDNVSQLQLMVQTLALQVPPHQLAAAPAPAAIAASEEAA